MLNIGLISKWHVHADGYAKQLQNDPRVKTTAVWDEDPARGEEWANELGAQFFTDYDAFLAADIAAVVCDSPTTMHRPLLIAAAKAGKHIFTEKLLATTTEDAEAIAAAIREAGVTFTISLPVKCQPATLYVKQLIETGKLGQITGARFRRSHSGISNNWLPERWFNVADTGGGAMMDLGAHPVYVMSGLFGAPKRVTALMSNTFGTTSDENAIALAEFEGGVLATMETAFVTEGVPDILEVYGTGGAVYLRGWSLMQNIGDGMEEVDTDLLPESPGDPMQQFIQCCLDSTAEPPGLGLKDALVMTRIMEAAYASDASGGTVVL